MSKARVSWQQHLAATPARPASASPRSGRGATNFVTAAAYATLGGMPMLMITGQKPIKKSKQGRFQILDVVSMMGPITKFTHQMASSENIPSRVREAYRLAREGVRFAMEDMTEIRNLVIRRED